MTSTDGSTAPIRAVPQPVRLDRRLRGDILRFTTAERMVHRATGLLMLFCTASAACLYIGPLAQAVGRRYLMVTVHEWSGILLPVPFLLGLFSPAVRGDLRRLNRFTPCDREWLRAVRHRERSPKARPAGKFNAGQKLYAGWIAGAVLVMTATGLLMWFTRLLPSISRTSAIFVHDVLAYGIAIVLIGHVHKAFHDPEARRGMRTGRVARSWADREHSRWLAEEGRLEKP